MGKFSYVYCPPAKPFTYVAIPDLLKTKANEHPDLEIFISRKQDGSRQSLTYRELLVSAKRVAKFLISLNVRRQDRVGLLGSNSLNMIIAEIGILFAGAVILNLNVELKDASDARSILDMSDCRVVFVDPGENGGHESVLKSLNSKVGTDDYEQQKRTVIYLQPSVTESLTVTLKEVIANTPDDGTVFPEIYPEDEAVVLTTSSSTGKPKMVVYGHFNFTCMVQSYSDMDVNMSATQKVYNDRPFGWLGGTNLVYAILGTPKVFRDSPLSTNRISISEIWKIVKDENIVNAFLMPYSIYDLLTAGGILGKDQFWVKAISTGGQVIDNFHTQVIGRYCDELIIGYGSTETGGIAVRKPLKVGDILEAGDVGTPLPGVEIRIMDEEERPLPVGKSGEIQVRSHCMMKRYNMMEEMTAATFTTDTPAWCKTGDIGIIREDGRLIVQGRVKDNISRGGRKILPGAINSVIQQLTGINHVLTIAVPDSRLYEEICVCYTTITGVNLTPDAVKSYCKDTFSKDSAVDGLGIMPKYFLKFEKFQLLSTGKPDKQKIQNEAKHMLGLY